MGTVIITGSAGLVGSEASAFFADLGMDVVGIDNDMRSYFFGPEGSTAWRRRELQERLGRRYRHHEIDIRDAEAVEAVFAGNARDVQAVIHTAAQPSHDWAAREPRVDFGVNAMGTLILLEAVRKHCPEAPFIFTSTNKVYGDAPNRLPLRELESRWEIDPEHPYANGIGENMPIDQCLHSLFGASKAAADLLVQEYGRYFGMPTACLRGGCLTGPGHSGAELHGFLAYLMKCTVKGTPYTIFGYKGKQVRDNIHSADLIAAIDEIRKAPRCGEVYNIGGGRDSNCSIREAAAMCEDIAGRKLDSSYSEDNRTGDHIWWISDISKFKGHYPGWSLRYDVRGILEDIYEKNASRWLGDAEK